MSEPGGNPPLVSVGIVTWNSESDLPACLRALSEQTYTDLETIVVDNASEDRSVEVVRELAPEAEIVLHQENLGFCRAHNRAIASTQGKYYLALNPDAVLSENYIEALVDCLEARPEYGSAMGKIWLPEAGDGRPLDGAGLFLDRSRHQYLRGHGEIDRGQYDEPGEVFAVDGAASLFRRAMLEDVKVQGQVFDEDFFIYMEDVDLGWRARLFGWRSWYEPTATASHNRTFKPGVRRPMPHWLRRMAVRNRYLMLFKNELPSTWRRDWWRILLYDVQIWGYILLLEQTSLGAVPQILRSRKRALDWQERIRDRTRVTAEECLSWFG